MVDSLPNLLCLDDEDITNKERGVARDVIELCSSNTGEHLLLSCLRLPAKKLFALYGPADLMSSAMLEMKLASIEGLPTLKVSQ